MRDINKIYIHCSASDRPEQQTLQAVTYLHTTLKEIDIVWGTYDTHGKGFSKVGYHYLIQTDGTREIGRSLEEMGAGVRGDNYDSIHICLHGVSKFTPDQFYELNELLDELLGRFDLEIQDVRGHYEFDPGKSCPNFDMKMFRDAYSIRNMGRIPNIKID